MAPVGFGAGSAPHPPYQPRHLSPAPPPVSIPAIRRVCGTRRGPAWLADLAAARHYRRQGNGGASDFDGRRAQEKGASRRCLLCPAPCGRGRGAVALASAGTPGTVQERGAIGKGSVSRDGSIGGGWGSIRRRQGESGGLTAAYLFDQRERRGTNGIGLVSGMGSGDFSTV
jgi:hypothetical protein